MQNNPLAVVMAILLLAFGAGTITSYKFGHHRGVKAGQASGHRDNILLGELADCQLSASEKASALSQAQVALSQSSPMISKLQTHISDCDVEISELKEKLSFYETVYGANNTGFKLREFKLNQINNDEFEVQGLVSKSGDDRFNGVLKLTLADQGDNKVEKTLDLCFKHFKEVKQTIIVKEDWQPQVLELQLQAQDESIEAQQAILLNRSSA